MNTYIQITTLALLIVQHGIAGQQKSQQCPNLYDLCLTGPSTTYAPPKSNSLKCWGQSEGSKVFYCFNREKCGSDEVDVTNCALPEDHTYYSCPGITEVCQSPDNKKHKAIDNDVPQCWRIKPGNTEWECMHRPENGCGATWTYLDSRCKYEKPAKKPDCPNYFSFGWKRPNPIGFNLYGKDSPKCWGRRPGQLFYDLQDKPSYGGCPGHLIDIDECEFKPSDKQECLDGETECTLPDGKIHKLKDENYQHCWIKRANGGYDCAIGPRNTTCPTGSQFSCVKQ